MQQTSLTAYYNEVKPSLGERQAAVYAVLEKDSLTNSEIAERLNAKINTITPRVFELRTLGLVVMDTQRKCRITGRTAIAWKRISNTLF